MDFREKSTEGVITKVCTNRRTGKPKFEVYVEETKETYTQLDLDYVLRYSCEVPLKYHELKAEYIVRLSRLAGLQSRPEYQIDEQDAAKKPPADVSKKIAGSTNDFGVAQRPKSKGKQPSNSKHASGKESHPRGSKKDILEDADLMEFLDSDVDSEDEIGAFNDSDGSDVEDGLEEDADANFIKWQFNTPPTQPNTQFTGASGPRKTLSPETATPFDYFCLFIPTYL